jgi:phthiocerol/phenolphthiocerol synthesis type-I polyketide synthase E
VSRHRDGHPIPEDLPTVAPAPVPAPAPIPAPVPTRTAPPAAPPAAIPPPVPDTPVAPARAEAGSTVDRVVAIFSTSLGITEISSTDDFFELGGNSLTAVEVMNQVRKEFAVDLSIAALFDHPTIEQLATELQRRGAA